MHSSVWHPDRGHGCGDGAVGNHTDAREQSSQAEQSCIESSPLDTKTTFDSGDIPSAASSHASLTMMINSP
ncbi:hypothetical protein TZ00_07270 [Agreia bicolorata]|uniref:Uncharacterized protein n=1 Tax=Agreia bicolorata TaxID=110935 RepID=A0ABR5CF85_9MICO|nr:hypothetical protein TZ00_07270 [Agreia bicolorata]